MATSSVKNEESTKVGVPSEACKRTEPLDTLHMLSNNLILIKQLRGGYHRHIIQYDVDIVVFEKLLSILRAFKKRLKKLGDFENYVDKLDELFNCFESIEKSRYINIKFIYEYFDPSEKKQSELFFKLRQNTEDFQQFLEELKSLLTKKLLTFENAANGETTKNVVSIIKECLRDVPILKNISRYIQYDHSTSVFIILEEFLALDDNLKAFWKDIDTKENTKKALLQLQMSVKKKKKLLLKDSKKENVEEKTREDGTKNLSEMEYFLERISKSFTGHSYALVDRGAVSSMCERWDFDTNDFYPDILNFDVFKKSVSNLKIVLSNYNSHLEYYPIYQKFNNIGSRRYNLQLHHWMREVATHLEEYQMDLNKKLSNQQKSKDQTYNKSIEEIKNTLEKLKPLPGFLEEIKKIFVKPTLLCIDLDKYLQFDYKLLNYWNKLKEFSDDNADKLLRLRSKIKKRKKEVLKEKRIAEKISNLELSGKNDGFQGKALEVVD